MSGPSDAEIASAARWLGASVRRLIITTDQTVADAVVEAARALGWPGLPARVGLPVIATCGGCAECLPASTSDDLFCAHEDAPLDRKKRAPTVDPDMPPPDWCPLRKEQP